MFKRKLICLALLPALFACAEASDEEAPVQTLDTAVQTSAPPAADAGLMDPNTATAEQLAAVPHMDAARVDALMKGRPFANMTAVDAVLTGLTDEQRDSVYTRVWKPIDLNKATPAEIELIPGVGPKMRHEFEEYRPWTSIEQFRREIGKYVDEAEVARLERYVANPATTTTQ